MSYSTSKLLVKAIENNDKESRKEILLKVFRRNGEKASNVVSGRKQTIFINCINFEKYFVFLSLGDVPH